MYGTVPGFHNSTTDADSGALSEYFLDGDELSGTFLGRPNEDTVFQQMFFQSNTNVISGQHSLIVTIANDTIVDNTPGFWVDFFVVIPPSTTTISSSASSPSHSRPGQSSVNIGPVVGGAVGGAIFLMALFSMVSLYLFCRNRRRRRRASVENGGLFSLVL